jgi:hypothetical protein
MRSPVEFDGQHIVAVTTYIPAVLMVKRLGVPAANIVLLSYSAADQLTTASVEFAMFEFDVKDTAAALSKLFRYVFVSAAVNSSPVVKVFIAISTPVYSSQVCRK